jgi:cobalt/nickel transport protein
MKKREILFGLLLAALVALFLSPFASPWPDGLERVAHDKGFLQKAEEVKHAVSSPIPDYVFPGLKNEKVATSIAGILGTFVMFGVGYGVARLLKKRRT